MTELDVARHSRLVDPQLQVWGWEIPVYLFLGGMAAGVMVLSALLLGRPGERSRAARWLPLAVPVLVSVGMLALFLDLEHKSFVWRFYLAFRWTSPMSWGAWVLLLVYPVSLLLALAALSDEQGERLARAAGPLAGPVRRARAWALPRAAGLRAASVAVGIGLGLYTGVLLSTLGARALWASALLGPLFLVSGLSTGAALMMLTRLDPTERRLLARWDLLLIGAEVALLLLFVVGLATGDAASHEAAGLLLGGRYTFPFWALVVGLGLAVPAALELAEARLAPALRVVAPALVLLGGLALRWIVVSAGQA